MTLRKQMRISPLDFDAINALVNDIQALESRAHRLMMLKTAHALNLAKNNAGWELAEAVELARSFAKHPNAELTDTEGKK